MLHKIHLENFKGLTKVELKLKRINILIGKNGSGKSSIIHALSVLKKSAQASGGHVILNLGYINLGAFEDVLGKAKESKIEITGSRLFTSEYFVGETIPVDYSLGLRFDKSGMLNYNSSISATALGTMTNRYSRYGGTLFSPEHLQFRDLATFSLQLTNQVGYVFSTSGIGHSRRVQPDENELINRAYGEVQSLAGIIHEELENTHVVSALRGLIEPRHALLQSKTPDVSIEPGIREMGASFSTNLVYIKAIKEKISDFAKKITGVEIEVEPQEHHKVIVTNPAKDTNIVNEGFGSNQLIFLLEKLVSSARGALLCIEEPELHLHPSAQWELANILCDISLAEDKRMIITTHSEHIIYAILARIAKGGLTSDDVGIFSFEVDHENRPTTVKELKVDSKGRIEGGLEGFIDANLKALDEFISRTE
jgi:predicted ATPase